MYLNRIDIRKFDLSHRIVLMICDLSRSVSVVGFERATVSSFHSDVSEMIVIFK